MKRNITYIFVIVGLSRAGDESLSPVFPQQMPIAIALGGK